MQLMLYPFTCQDCGCKYYESGYLYDERYCPSCSVKARAREEEKKKELAKRAAEIAEKYGLDFDKYPDEIPEEIRNVLNPRNAGRKTVKYKKEYCELLVEMAAEGKEESEFCAAIKVSQGLLTYWTERRPNFKVARETANEVREAWFEAFYRRGMAGLIPVVPSMVIRKAAAKYGWRDRTEAALTGTGGEIPVVKLVERDAGFPSETLAPGKEQLAAAGLEAQAV